MEETEKTIEDFTQICSDEVYCFKQLEILNIVKGLPTSSAKEMLNKLALRLDALSIVSQVS